MKNHPLDQSASPSQLQEWRQQGHVSEDVFTFLMTRLRSVEVWRRWGALSFLVMGVALLLCGIVFFFAWNWEGMPRWQRLGLAGLGGLLPALASRLLGPDALVGKMCLMAASFMIGVFLAVFGQEYQTGADTYGLFVGWALLALPWALCAVFEPLWILWLVILSTGLVLLWKDVLMHPPNPWPWPYLLLALAGLHAVALLLKETFAARGWPWLEARWSRLWLLFVILGVTTALPCLLMIDFRMEDAQHVATGAVVWLLMAGVSFWVYRYRLKDAAAMSLPVLSAGVVVVTTAARWLWEMMDAIGDSALILGGMVIYTASLGAIIAACVWLVRKLTLDMATGVPPALPKQAVSEEADGPLTWNKVLQDLDLESKARLEEQVSLLVAKPREPVWLKLVSAMGGWVAAWTFLPMLFFVIGVLWDDGGEGVLMICGVLFLAGTVWLSRILPKTVFLQQMNLALAIGSFSLINTGLISVLDGEAWGVFVLLQCVISAVTYALFNNAPYRFLVTVWSAATVVAWAAISDKTAGMTVPMIILPLTAVTTWLWVWRQRPEALNPLAYAMAFSLASAVLFYGLVTDMAWMELRGTPRFGSMALAIALMVLLAMLNRGLQSLTSPWMIGVAIVALPLALTGEMGVLTAMLLAAAAFGWGDKLLGVFAWSFLAGFLFLFYYHMHIPLSYKAAVMGGSGVIFLVLRSVLLRLNNPTSASV